LGAISYRIVLLKRGPIKWTDRKEHRELYLKEGGYKKVVYCLKNNFSIGPVAS
jgi:hypothetical protein